jgi:hypothetical protein
MKKLYSVIFALYLPTFFVSCGSSPQPEAGAAPQPVEIVKPVESPKPMKPVPPPEPPKDPRFDGGGGKDITLAVLEPASGGLTPEEQYLASFVQGVLTSDLSRVTAMKIIDRPNLDRLIGEQVAMSGLTADGDVKIGQIASARLVLGGKLIKTRTGFSLQLNVTDTESAVVKASYNAATATAGEIERSVAVKDAAADLLSQLGINLTGEGRNLLYGAGEKTVAAETALAKGLTAQRAASTPKTTVEALSYLYEAQSLDPSLLEAADRLAAYQAAVFTAPEVRLPELAVPVHTGNIGADARNAIERWKAQGDAIRQQQKYLLDQRALLLQQQKTLLDKQRELIALLRETENFYAAHPPFEIIYDPKVEPAGEVDYRKETVHLRFPLTTMSTVNLGVMRNILDSLGSMKQGFGSINDGLDKIQEQITRVNAAGKEYAVQPVADIQAGDKNNGASWSPDRWMKGDGRTFAVQSVLTNDQGKRLGTATVTLKNEITDTAYTLPVNANGYCVFRDVGANDITDTLRISITRINGVALDNADNAGYIRISPLDASSHTEEGYDIDGYRGGYDRNGYNRSGRDKDGYDRSGWGKDGYNSDKSASKYREGMVGPAGGYIFADKGIFSYGSRFLEAVPASAEFEADWVDAKKRCQDMTINGFTGWRLPNREELNLMYVNLKQKGLGGFKNDEYWSSESNEKIYNALGYLQSFRDGEQGTNSGWSRARAVRAF